MIINSQISRRNEGRISEKELIDNILYIRPNKSSCFNQFYFFILLLKVDDRICGKKRPYHLGHTGYQCSFRFFHKWHVKKKNFQYSCIYLFHLLPILPSSHVAKNLGVISIMTASPFLTLFRSICEIGCPTLPRYLVTIFSPTERL